MKFLDTRDRMEIVESEEYATYKFIIEKDLFNLSLIDFHKTLGDFVKDCIKNNKRNVKLVLESAPGVKRVEMVNLYYSFLSIFVKYACSATEDKFEEHHMMPREEISNSLNAPNNIMRELINKSCAFDLINIEVIWKDRKITSLV